ncbi:MAG: hypothetical protein MJE68_27380 [Proteobacteria bacterium]|nr:hypothetical protein [Pseudomonadota bacterium]
MASGRNTPEYLTIVAKTDYLRLALQNDLISIGGSLVACGFISPDQYSRLRNGMFTESERAADLVQWIQNKVQQNAQNYRTFIGVLQKDTMQYSHALTTLQEELTQRREGMVQHLIAALTVIIIWPISSSLTIFYPTTFTHSIQVE